jgi:hypothetical protein
VNGYGTFDQTATALAVQRVAALNHGGLSAHQFPGPLVEGSFAEDEISDDQLRAGVPTLEFLGSFGVAALTRRRTGSANGGSSVRRPRGLGRVESVPPERALFVD